MKLTDTHCHLYLDAFAEDLDEVLQRAAEADVVKMVVPGIDLETSRAALELAEQHEQVYAAVGVYPNRAAEWNEQTGRELSALAANEKVVAIGEIGLDNHWGLVPKDMQERVFQEQLEIAANLDKPIIVHSRKATSDILRQLTRWIDELAGEKSDMAVRPGVMHSFSGNAAQAENAIELGLMIGVAGPVTFKNAEEHQRIIAGIPLENILIETDSPYLSPHPQRGKRNEPSQVGLVNGKISALKNSSAKETAGATYANAARLFKW